jgi:hypothetical protein
MSRRADTADAPADISSRDVLQVFVVRDATTDLIPDTARDAPVAPDAAAGSDAAADVADHMQARTTLRLRVIDSKTRAPIPAAVAIFDAVTGSMLRFGRQFDQGFSMGTSCREIGTGGALATWQGILLWRGEAVLPVDEAWEIPDVPVEARTIPHGRYRLVASRGIEYDLTEATVGLSPGMGEVRLELPLARAIDRQGYIAADMHVHQAPHSGDSRLSARDRLKAMAAAGIDVVVGADHNSVSPLAEAAAYLWPADMGRSPLFALDGTEITVRQGHFNVFPLTPDRTRPARGAPVPPTGLSTLSLMTFLRSQTPRSGVFQLNHARLEGNAYFEHASCGPWRDRTMLPSCPVEFDAIEVLNGYVACPTRILEAVTDWYALLSLSRPITAVGNSDSHGASNVLGGFPRTYVRYQSDSETFETEAFTKALRGRQAVATTGPFLTLRVDGVHGEGSLVRTNAGKVTVGIRMQAASWVVVDEVRLRANGSVLKTWRVPRVGAATPFFEIRETLTVSKDTFITAEAYGERALPTFIVGDAVKATGTGCPGGAPGLEGMPPFAITNPVFVDVDGGGAFGVRM